jgi:hypothetical protein
MRLSSVVVVLAVAENDSLRLLVIIIIINLSFFPVVLVRSAVLQVLAEERLFLFSYCCCADPRDRASCFFLQCVRRISWSHLDEGSCGVMLWLVLGAMFRGRRAGSLSEEEAFPITVPPSLPFRLVLHRREDRVGNDRE